MATPEELAREKIDELLVECGWTIQNRSTITTLICIGLTATPSKQTISFFNKNLIMEYGHERAVADQVNVNYDLYKIDICSQFSLN
jgi:type I site-specific restriction endonuclease